jgi:acyl-CoA synthetase (AMP-forming)/AMP-acid ligase II
MNLVEKLGAQAELDPERWALVDGGGRAVTFGGLRKSVRRVAAELDRAGLGPGDRVLVFHPVAIELYEFLLGCFHAGVTVVLADPSGGRGFLEQVCERVRPEAFFGSRKAHLLRWTIGSLRRIPRGMHPRGWWPASRPVMNGTREAGLFEAQAEHPALITFTSGSTGEPKGAVRTHGFLLAQHQALSAALELVPGERDLVTLPVFALANLASGVTSVLADADLGRPGEADPGRIVAQCRRWEVERATAAPAFFEALLAGGAAGTLRKVFTGGAPVFPDLIRRLREVGIEATAVYGSTEAEPVAEFPSKGWTPEVLEKIKAGRGLPAGRPVLEVAVLPDRFGEPVEAMTADAFEAQRLAVGEIGEIVVAGPQVLTGYLDGRGDDETKIRVGDRVWHRTGDAGWLDAGGGLWLVGRCTAKLGERYPLQIEAALRLRFPQRRTSALQVADEVVLVVEGEADRELASAARELGCSQVRSVDRLPMDRRHQSKIDYPKLREMVGS